MNQTNISTPAFSLASVLVLALFPICFGTLLRAQSRATVQPPPSTLTFTVPNYDDSFTWPLNIISIKTGSQLAPVDKPIMLSDPAWLNSLVIEVKNVSSKTIVEAGMEISFPDSGRGTSDDPLLAYQIHKGVYPDVALMHHDGTSTPRSQLPNQSSIAVSPGGTIKFVFTDSGETADAAYALRATIKTVRINFLSVYFNDSSKWMAGSYSVPTSSLNTWRRVNLTEFEQFSKIR